MDCVIVGELFPLLFRVFMLVVALFLFESQ